MTNKEETVFFEFPKDLKPLEEIVENGKWLSHWSMKTSLSKLKYYVDRFNEILDWNEDNPGYADDDRYHALNEFKEHILRMKKELGINLPIQKYYF